MTSNSRKNSANAALIAELSAALRKTVEDTYGYVRVRGEISGFRGQHGSGHCYFSLKDEGARIEAVIWKFAHARMRFKPQEGLEVIATGKLTTYPGSSKYQIVIEALEPEAIAAHLAQKGVDAATVRDALGQMRRRRAVVHVHEAQPALAGVGREPRRVVRDPIPIQRTIVSEDEHGHLPRPEPAGERAAVKVVLRSVE